VIATGFNRRGSTPMVNRTPKPMKIVEKIPTGVSDLQKYDEPAYIRRGVDLGVPGPRVAEQEQAREKIDKSDPERPAFLRKIMD
jgi:hypothetical protein